MKWRLAGAFVLAALWGRPALGGVRPDFYIVDLSGPASATPGQTISVDCTVGNQGDDNGLNFRVGFYLSGDDTINTANDTLVDGSWVISDLAPSESESNTVQFQIPPATPSGTYYYGPYADDEKVTPETDFADNWAVVQIQIAGAASPTTTPFDGGCSAGVCLPAALAAALGFSRRRRSERWAPAQE